MWRGCRVGCPGSQRGDGGWGKRERSGSKTRKRASLGVGCPAAPCAAAGEAAASPFGLAAERTLGCVGKRGERTAGEAGTARGKCGAAARTKIEARGGAGARGLRLPPGGTRECVAACAACAQRAGATRDRKKRTCESVTLFVTHTLRLFFWLRHRPSSRPATPAARGRNTLSQPPHPQNTSCLAAAAVAPAAPRRARALRPRPRRRAPRPPRPPNAAQRAA